MSTLRFLIFTPWFLVGTIWIGTAWRGKPAQASQPLSRRLAQSALLTAVAILMFFEWPSNDFPELRALPASSAFVVVGIALTFAGALVATMARFSLGGNWSCGATIRHDHELIRSGPYAWVRHPMYFGLLVSAIGTAIALGELRQFLALPLLLIAFRMKQLSEEQLLLRAFGERYVDYRRSVRWAMMPFVL